MQIEGGGEGRYPDVSLIEISEDWYGGGGGERVLSRGGGGERVPSGGGDGDKVLLLIHLVEKVSITIRKTNVDYSF